MADEDSVDLSEFTTMEDDAAQTLSSHPSDLNLENLTMISDESATSLGKHCGDELRLSSLLSITDKVDSCKA